MARKPTRALMRQVRNAAINGATLATLADSFTHGDLDKAASLLAVSMSGGEVDDATAKALDLARVEKAVERSFELMADTDPEAAAKGIMGVMRSIDKRAKLRGGTSTSAAEVETKPAAAASSALDEIAKRRASRKSG